LSFRSFDYTFLPLGEDSTMGEAVVMQWNDAQKLARKLYEVTVRPLAKMGLDWPTKPESVENTQAKRQRMER
jgi:hypothetical protein